MHTRAKYLLTSFRYNIVALFSLIMELDSASYALPSPSSLKLKIDLKYRIVKISKVGTVKIVVLLLK